MAKCYQLIGIPGSGKTTWAKSQDWIQDCAYVSTDIWVEIEANRQGKTYSEVFEDYMPKAVNIMSAQVIDARDQEQDIVWDQTSTTIISRMRKFNMLPNYEHIAVVFRCPDADELIRRLNSRLGKVIPLDVIESMVHNFEVPSEEEGFKEIWFVN
jgi:adenylate kinase family enzyme